MASIRLNVNLFLEQDVPPKQARVTGCLLSVDFRKQIDKVCFSMNEDPQPKKSHLLIPSLDDSFKMLFFNLLSSFSLHHVTNN